MKKKLYLALMALICVALAAWLSAAAVQLYQEGLARRAEQPLAPIYTPEAVAQRLAPMAPLFFAGLGLMAAGLALGLRDERQIAPDPELQRDLLARRGADSSPQVLAERRRQRRLTGLGWGLFALSMIPTGVYLADPAHVPPDDLEAMLRGLLRVLLPCAALGLGALAVTSALRDRSLRREIEALRERRKAEGAAPGGPAPRPAGRRIKPGWARAALMAAAIGLIVAGALNGSALDVLYKAITICTECVGLG